jgi:hypothetical protein
VSITVSNGPHVIGMSNEGRNIMKAHVSMISRVRVYRWGRKRGKEIYVCDVDIIGEATPMRQFPMDQTAALDLQERILTKQAEWLRPTVVIR